MPPASHDDEAEHLVMEWLLSGFGTTNRNARYSVLYWVTVSLSNGILFSGTLGLLMQQVTLSLSKVGYSEGLFGACALIPGFVGGHFADKSRRDRVIRAGAVLSCISSTLLCALCLACLISQDVLDSLQPAAITPVPSANSSSSDSSSDEGYIPNQIDGIGSYLFLMVCIVTCGVYIGESLSDAAYNAIQADSLETGNRQDFTGKLRVWCNYAYVLGPTCICLPFLLANGNSWNTRSLLAIVCMGVLVRLPCIYICFLFNDDYSLARASESISEVGKQAVKQKKPGDNTQVGSEYTNPRYAYIPFIYLVSNIIVCTGSGMTVKFFPIFFEDSMHLSPVTVYIVIAVLPLLRAWGIKGVMYCSKKIGRIQTDILWWVVGITALMGLIIQSHSGALHTNAQKAVGVGLFLMRCVCLQSTAFIQQTVMGDFVPKRHRARWAAFSAISQVGWSGSAVVGGVLIDKFGYEFTFMITCLAHYLSLGRGVLMCIVPRWEITVPPAEKESTTHAQTINADSDEEDETAPLVSQSPDPAMVVQVD